MTMTTKFFTSWAQQRVSLVTWTSCVQDRMYWPNLILMLSEQQYPLSCVEWIIVDSNAEGETMQDLIDAYIPQLIAGIYKVQYLRATPGMPWHEQQRMAYDACSHSIIVHWIKDAYYPPSRIDHAVQQIFQSNARVVMAGCMEQMIWTLKTREIFISVMKDETLCEQRKQQGCVLTVSAAFTKAWWHLHREEKENVFTLECSLYDCMNKKSVPCKVVMLEIQHVGFVAVDSYILQPLCIERFYRDYQFRASTIPLVLRDWIAPFYEENLERYIHNAG